MRPYNLGNIFVLRIVHSISIPQGISGQRLHAAPIEPNFLYVPPQRWPGSQSFLWKLALRLPLPLSSECGLRLLLSSGLVQPPWKKVLRTYRVLHYMFAAQSSDLVTLLENGTIVGSVDGKFF